MTGRARSRAQRLTTALCGAALGALVLFVYRGVGGFGFVAYDDGSYVTDVPQVQHGLSSASVAWAFTTTWAANWHPLTWLSLMVDASLFGTGPGSFHRINVAWHLANILLLWATLETMTHARWRSLLAAALFAIHPLHVESVAWISERKDVLSTTFWLLALAAYVAWTRRPSPGRYAAVAGCMALGLLAKPMVVTLPLTLLILDYWPLGRLEPGTRLAERSMALWREKVPLFALAACSGLATVVAQHRGGATATVEAIPMAARLGNAILSAGAYLEKTVWPASLAVFYPHPATAPGGMPWGRVAISAVLLLALTVAAIWQRRRRPFLLAGWLWYLVTLLPVIGLLQVGRQGMADRYTYVPLVGIFVALAWSVPSSWCATFRGRAALASAAAALVLALALAAHTQVGYWRDSFTLFDHAAQVTEGNWLAWKNLGSIHHQRGEPAAALAAFQESVRALSDEADTWFDLGVEYVVLDQHFLAAQSFEQAALLNPKDVEVWLDLGTEWAILGQTGRAAGALERLVQLDPARARELTSRLARIASQRAGR